MRSEPAGDNAPLQGRVPTGTCFSFFLLLIRGNTFIRLPRHFPPARFTSCENCQGWKASGELGESVRAGLCSLLPPRRQRRPSRDSTQQGPWSVRKRFGDRMAECLTVSMRHALFYVCPVRYCPGTSFSNPSQEPGCREGPWLPSPPCLAGAAVTRPCPRVLHHPCPRVPPSCPGQFAISIGVLHPL